MPCAALDFNVLLTLFHLLITLVLSQNSLHKSTFLSPWPSALSQLHTIAAGPLWTMALSWGWCLQLSTAWEVGRAEKSGWAPWERATCGVDVFRQTSPESRQVEFPTEWPGLKSPWLAQVIKSSLCCSKLTHFPLGWVWRKFCNHFPNIRNYLYIRY